MLADFLDCLFLISIFTGTVILLLASGSIFSRKIQFWPPPNKNSWQLKLFWVLFALFSLPLFCFVVVDFDQKNKSELLFTLGFTLSLIGLIFANIVSYNLGFKNTSGQKGGLRTTGWYSVSRNPVYVATMTGLIGIMVAIPTFEIVIISLLWIFIYILAPLVEEPWLEEKYGDEYLKYKMKVRRFI